MRTLLTFLLAFGIAAPASAAVACPQGLPTDGVTLKLSTEISSTVPSTSIGIEATMENTLDVTVQDVMLLAELRDERGSVVQRVEVPQRITILPRASAKAAFAFPMPAGLRDGEYRMYATAVPVTARRADALTFNIGPRAELAFIIHDGAPATAVQSGSSVGGAEYSGGRPAAVPTDISPIVVARELRNDGDGPYRGTLAWRVYSHDATMTDAPIMQRTDTVELHPGAVDVREIDLSAPASPAYYIETELSDGVAHQFGDIWVQDSGSAALPGFSCDSVIRDVTRASGAILMSALLAVFLVVLIGVGVYVQRRASAV